MTKPKNEYLNREISWLHFNDRVLQESADKDVPLIERLRFLGIFSNNLDEFFKVRYATVKRIVDAGKSGKSVLGGETAKDLLEEITKNVIQLQSKSGRVLKQIERELATEQIFIIDETQVGEDQADFVKDYFLQNVNPELITIILNNLAEFPTLKDTAAYLAVRMVLHQDAKIKFTDSGIQYALIEIPKRLDRFVVLPEKDGKNYIMMVDDVIRFSMNQIFTMFEYKDISAHMIKITRDAELDMDNDLSKSFIEKISSSVEHRKISDPVRFVYDKGIKMNTLRFLRSKMKIEETDSVIPGGRYHNRRDYMGFPSLGRADLQYKRIQPLLVKNFDLNASIIGQVALRDYMIYTPYQNYSYVINFLKEAALDPQVKKIKLTVYRLANNSQVAAALINAAKNGKEVTVQIELQARFDEQANIKYANQFQEEGIKLIFGIPGLKVHTKVCFIEREEENGIKRYGFISTGNFNESTAKIYTDYTLFTAHDAILKEVNKIFDFFEVPYKINKYKHLIVSPHYTKNVFIKLIDNEIANALVGKEAFIKIKMNSFTSYKMVDKLYEASRAGVKVQLIIRGICCLIPGVTGMSENIEAISVVDKFLEHPRVFIFGNEGNPKIYISSADWMTRNLDYRVEVGCPIYNDEIKQEILDTFEISWNDNIKARVFSAKHDNAYKDDSLPKSRSQFALYDYYLKKAES
ncbi:polyphosphate kinase 1 [Croceitalea rosinachiae]|uniref:Polyphosphate kinase n=1 Tax=Croceitalea rosinachiae TaxID=3075596 RepID=A0ABU3AF05_9FLAO|nr:polyphosphate kinase 1 [Croceitalea sp. F388]MDT0608508.1 polyphosphate kinase 1 [Croceitalea sp. F388]